jgi:hypothetical protein
MELLEVVTRSPVASAATPSDAAPDEETGCAMPKTQLITTVIVSLQTI